MCVHTINTGTNLLIYGMCKVPYGVEISHKCVYLLFLMYGMCEMPYSWLKVEKFSQVQILVSQLNFRIVSQVYRLVLIVM